MINNKYSDWFKIDLHIHTDWSKKTKDNDYKGIFSVEKLHEKLTANQVGIFSLTDHNIINLPAYEEYYTKYNNESPLLLIGVELDIKLDTDSNKRDYHSLLIFKDSTIENVRNISEKLERKYIEKGIRGSISLIAIIIVGNLTPKMAVKYIGRKIMSDTHRIGYL